MSAYCYIFDQVTCRLQMQPLYLHLIWEYFIVFGDGNPLNNSWCCVVGLWVCQVLTLSLLLPNLDCIYRHSVVPYTLWSIMLAICQTKIMPNKNQMLPDNGMCKCGWRTVRHRVRGF